MVQRGGLDTGRFAHRRDPAGHVHPGVHRAPPHFRSREIHGLARARRRGAAAAPRRSATCCASSRPSCITAIATLAIFNTLGISILPFLATAGVAGIAIAFGAQSLVKDFFRGFFLLAENQIRQGDVVEVAGKSGLVEDLTLRYVQLRDYEGNVHYVPERRDRRGDELEPHVRLRRGRHHHRARPGRRAGARSDARDRRAAARGSGVRAEDSRRPRHRRHRILERPRHHACARASRCGRSSSRT